MRAKRAMPGGHGVLCAMGLMTVRPLRICEIVGIAMGEYRKTRCSQRVPVGAPGGTRTHTAQILRLLPLPIGIQGRIQTLSSVQHNRDRVQMLCFAGRLRRVCGRAGQTNGGAVCCDALPRDGICMGSEGNVFRIMTCWRRTRLAPCCIFPSCNTNQWFGATPFAGLCVVLLWWVETYI